MNAFDVTGFIIAIIVAVAGSLYAFKKQKRRSLDGYLVKKLEDSGIDVLQKQNLQFWFYSNEESAIRSVEEELAHRDFEVVVNDTDADPGYVMHAFKNMVPDIAELQLLRAEFNKLSRRHGVKYDGWGYASDRDHS